jgi:hypothetical protein
MFAELPAQPALLTRGGEVRLQSVEYASQATSVRSVELGSTLRQFSFGGKGQPDFTFTIAGVEGAPIPDRHDVDQAVEVCRYTGSIVSAIPTRSRLLTRPRGCTNRLAARNAP